MRCCSGTSAEDIMMSMQLIWLGVTMTVTFCNCPHAAPCLSKQVAGTLTYKLRGCSNQHQEEQHKHASDNVAKYVCSLECTGHHGGPASLCRTAGQTAGKQLQLDRPAHCIPEARHRTLACLDTLVGARRNSKLVAWGGHTPQQHKCAPAMSSIC